MSVECAATAPVHPGRILINELEKLGMSQKELAVRTGVTEKHVSTIITGKKNISATFAKKLEYALGISASKWMDLQADYDRRLIELEEKHGISSEELEITKILKDVIGVLSQYKLIKTEVNDVDLVLQLRKLMRVNNLTAIPDIPYSAAYRAQVRNNVRVDAYVLYAWQRLCEIVTEPIAVKGQLNPGLLQSRLSEIKDTMFLGINDIRKRLTNIFAECGIAFAIVHNFQGAPVQGFIKQTVQGKTILCLTLRQKRADTFWFTLFHEIGHLLKGDASTRFVDFKSVKSEQEAQADSFARDVLIQPKAYREFIRQRDYSFAAIKKFARSLNVKPFVVVGRLQSDELIDWTDCQASIEYYGWAAP